MSSAVLTSLGHGRLDAVAPKFREAPLPVPMFFPLVPGLPLLSFANSMQTGAGEQNISPKCMDKRCLVLINVTWERADLIVTRFPHWLESRN
jgi:hypothetical protein